MLLTVYIFGNIVEGLLSFTTNGAGDIEGLLHSVRSAQNIHENDDKANLSRYFQSTPTILLLTNSLI